MPATVPAAAARAMSAGDPAPAGLSDKEKAAYDQLSTFFARNDAYGSMMSPRPQTVGYGLSDPPIGLGAGCTTSSINGPIVAATRKSRSPKTRCSTTFHS